MASAAVIHAGEPAVTHKLLTTCRPLSRMEATEVSNKEVYFVPHKRFIYGGINNNGFDDENNRYLSQVGDHINYRYQVESKLGRGAFGDCWMVFDHKTKQRVALKVIRNERRFLNQGKVEVNILETLSDQAADHNCVTMIDHFMFRNHLCITFELHSHDLYTELKARDFIGFAIPDIRSVVRDVLKSLVLLSNKKIVHADLKPENILLAGETGSDVMVIDFGSSCKEHGQIHTYVQSRYYRAPEIMLGLGYGTAIDMWSLGCVMAELLTGRPLFGAKNEKDLLLYQMELLGPIPDSLLHRANRTKDFFRMDSSGISYVPLKIVDRKGRVREVGSRTLRSVFKTVDAECLDFLSKVLVFDPKKRISPQEALEHPFFNSNGLVDRKWSSNGSIDSGVESVSAEDTPYDC